MQMNADKEDKKKIFMILNLIHLRTSADALEIGCGEGTLLAAMRTSIVE